MRDPRECGGVVPVDDETGSVDGLRGHLKLAGIFEELVRRDNEPVRQDRFGVGLPPTAAGIE
jgi:hypothetical protein